jgi:hypothetical protein
MEPGEQIIAGTWAVTGPTPWLEMLSAVPYALVLAVAGITTSANLVPFWELVNLASLLLLFMRRPVFVAVTQRQLICYRLSRMNNAPVRLLFCAPLPSTRVTTSASAPRWRSIRYDGPGAEGRSLRLNVAGRWRQDLDEVLAALQAQGGSVESLPRTGHAFREIFP